MDFAYYQPFKAVGLQSPYHTFVYKFQLLAHFPFPKSIPRESRTDFWRLSDISAKSGTVGEK